MADNSQSLFSSFKKPAAATSAAPVTAQVSTADAAKMQALEKAGAAMKAELAALKAELTELKAQPRPLAAASPAEAAADRALTEAKRPDFGNLPSVPPAELAAELMKAWAVLEAYKTKTAAHDVKLGGAVKFTEELAARVSAQEQKLAALAPLAAVEDIKKQIFSSELKMGDELKKFDARLGGIELKLGGTVKMAEELFARATSAEKRIDSLPQREDLEKLESRLAAVDKSNGEGLDKAVARLAEQDAKLETGFKDIGARLEAWMAEQKACLDSQSARLDSAQGVAPMEAIQAMRKQVDEALAGFAALKTRVEAVAADFEAVERDSRAALGEAKGFFAKLERDPGLDRVEAAAKEAAARMEAKVAAAEAKLHEAMGELTARLLRTEETEKKAVEGVGEIREKLASFAEEFTVIQRECRAALGEMTGLLDKAEHSAAIAKLNSYVKDMFGRLESKLASAEGTMHEALGSLSAKMTAADAANDKKISETGEKLEKEALAEVRKFAAGQAEAGKEAAWLKEEYQVRLSRQLREMEARYSALTALSKRVDILAEKLDAIKGT